jgi:hypothetical protein
VASSRKEVCAGESAKQENRVCARSRQVSGKKPCCCFCLFIFLPMLLLLLLLFTAVACAFISHFYNVDWRPHLLVFSRFIFTLFRTRIRRRNSGRFHITSRRWRNARIFWCSLLASTHLAPWRGWYYSFMQQKTLAKFIRL